jgi:hypothetical protein
MAGVPARESDANSDASVFFSLLAFFACFAILDVLRGSGSLTESARRKAATIAKG